MERIEFRGFGIKIVGDAAGDPNGTPVVLMHGAGQTRASWGAALDEIGRAGFYAISLDLRGHGESGWPEDVDYSHDAGAEDLRHVVEDIGRPPFLVGASRGGRVALAYAGKGYPQRGVVLVDVAPRIEIAGTRRVGDFMRAWPDGFASLEAAADAVAAYLPHRPRPKDPSGLMKNLRQGDDGRLHWHWDPRMAVAHPSDEELLVQNDRLSRDAATIKEPVLLIRGMLSDMVSDESVTELRALVPHSESVDVRDADHMVAGDRNDAFNSAVLSFLRRHA